MGQANVPSMDKSGITSLGMSDAPSGAYVILGPLKCVLIGEVSSFRGVNNTYLYEFETWSNVLIRDVSSYHGYPLRGVPLYLVDQQY